MKKFRSVLRFTSLPPLTLLVLSLILFSSNTASPSTRRPASSHQSLSDRYQDLCANISRNWHFTKNLVEDHMLLVNIVRDWETNKLYSKIMDIVYYSGYPKRMIKIPLKDLMIIHPINYRTIRNLNNLRNRANGVRKNRTKIEEHGLLQQQQADSFGNFKPIIVVKYKGNSYVALDGNGRIHAIEKAHLPPDTLIEVMEYDHGNNQELINLIEEKRKQHGFE